MGVKVKGSGGSEEKRNHDIGGVDCRWADKDDWEDFWSGRTAIGVVCDDANEGVLSPIDLDI